MATRLTPSIPTSESDLGKICVNKSRKSEEKALQRDYSLIESPLFKVKNELNYPCGLYIDDSANLVYFTDREDKRIKVWTLDGDYVSAFGGEVLEYPERITLTNKALFVTDSDQNCVFKFQLCATSSSNFKMVDARAICSSTDEVFVINKNNIILVLNTDLKVLKSFSGSIKNCFDIKIHNSILYLLEVDENVIKLLESKTGNLIKTVLTNKDGIRFDNACHFCLDQNGNFLITNWRTHQIKIITEDGTLLRLIDTSDWELIEPRGIEVSNSNKIVLLFRCGVFCQI